MEISVFWMTEYSVIFFGFIYSSTGIHWNGKTIYSYFWN